MNLSHDRLLGGVLGKSYVKRYHLSPVCPVEFVAKQGLVNRVWLKIEPNAWHETER